MRFISIISALSKSTLPYVEQSKKCIDELKLPPDFAIKWYIQQDGDSDIANFDWLRNPEIFFEYNGRHLGAALTRNQALLRTDSEFIFSYDPDDVLLPDSLALLLKGFENNEVVWSAGRWDELFEDGSTGEWRHPLYEGERPINWIYDEIMRLDKTPFSMNPVLYKRDSVVQAGGWPGFPEWEDTILLTVVSGHHKGWATDKLVGLYRRHASSITASSLFQDSKPKMYKYIKEIGRLQN